MRITRGLGAVGGALFFWAGCTAFSADDAGSTASDAGADAPVFDAGGSSPDAATADGATKDAAGPCVGSAACSTLYQGLLASWRFEKDQKDSSLNHLDLPAVEPASCTPSYGAGKHGQGHVNTSTNTSCSAMSSQTWSDLNVAGKDFTLAFWVQRTLPNPDKGWAHYSLFSDGQMVVGAWEKTLGNPQFYPTIQLLNGANEAVLVQETSFDFAQAANSGWTYIVAYRSSTTVGIKVNNKAPFTATQSTDVGALGELRVGEELSGNPWQGTVDDVAMWNRALTDAEMTALYNGGAGLELIP